MEHQRAGTEEAGVGVLMIQDPSDRIVTVKNCVTGGAAERDGFVKAGDMIASVNGHNAFGLSVQETRSMIVGPQGTTVVIGFHRPTGEVFERTLVRGTPEYLESLGPGQPVRSSLDPSYGLTSSRNNDASAPSVSLRSSVNQDHGHLPLRSSINSESLHIPLRTGSNTSHLYTPEQELSRLRGRLGELEAENTSLKDELYRNRQYMEKDRDSALRYAKEMEALHNKYADQISQLQGMLQQSELVQQDLQQQIVVARRREDELLQSMSFDKQHNGEREKYFADVRIRFDEELARTELIVAQEREARERAEQGRLLAEQALEQVMVEVDQVRQSEESRRATEEEIRSALHESNKRIMEASKEGEAQKTELEATIRGLEAWHHDFFEARKVADPPQPQADKDFLFDI